MKKINFLKKNKLSGFTLVETLVALSIFSISIVTLMSILSQDIYDTGYAKQKISAVSLAQEGIEYVKNIRDSYVLYTGMTGDTWDSFKTKLMMCTSSNCGFNTNLLVTDSNSVFLCSANISQCKLYINNGDYNVGLIGVDSGFTRTIRMTLLGTDEVKIYSTVSWFQADRPHSVTLTGDLFNWVE